MVTGSSFFKILKLLVKSSLFSTEILTLVVLNILCTILLSNFHSISLQHSSYKHVFTRKIKKKSVDPDQMASSEAS